MNGTDILSVTMAGLEAGFRVSDIAAFDLATCSPESGVQDVLKDPALQGFDHIPVRDGARVIGVLGTKASPANGSVRNCMLPLDDSMLVSGDEPLPKFLPKLEESPYRLVLKGWEIQGIVTLSDVAKLPVRLMAFTLVTHLEMVMAEVIQAKCPTDTDLFANLHPKQEKNVAGRLKRRKKDNLQISALDLTDLGHKITVIGKILRITGFEEQLKPVVELRNSLDHAVDFIEICGGVPGFLERLRLAESWIDELGGTKLAGTIS